MTSFPTDWDNYKLGELIFIKSGIGFKFSEYTLDGIPLVKIDNVSHGFISWENVSYVPVEYLKQYQDIVLEEGDILIALNRPITRGMLKIARIKKEDIPAILYQRVGKIIIHNNALNSYFAFFLLNKAILEFFVKQAIGSDQPFISLTDLQNYKVTIPPTKEQQKIAKILTTVDNLIEKTEALIEKYQAIKQGMMLDLFTRGIDINGQLRPSHHDAPHLYKPTELGWIPKEWDLEKCDSICTRICVGIVIQPTQYYVDEGIPAFRSANVREEGIDPSNFVYISPAANDLLVKSQVKAGDILSVRTGYPGTSAVVPKEFDGSNSIDILITTPGDRISSKFLCDWINSYFGKEQVLRQQGGMAQQHFNVGEMKELLVAVPPIEEQSRIRQRTSSVANKLGLEKEYLQKLQQQKKGLMQDLLTGKVRIQPYT